MFNQQLIDYIHQRLADNISRSDVIKELRSVGWKEPDLQRAFSNIGIPMQSESEAESSLQNTSYENNSFIPPNSIIGAHEARDSFWYRPIIIIITLVILMGVVVGGVYAYYAYIKQPSATMVLRGTFEKIALIKSVDIAATSTSIIATNATSSAPSIFGNTKFVYATTTTSVHGVLDLAKQSTHPNFDMIMELQSAIAIATTSGTYSLGLHAILSPNAFNLKLLRSVIHITSKQDPKIRLGVDFINTEAAKISNKWIRLIDFNATSSEPFLKIFSMYSASSTPAITKDRKALRAYVESLQYVRSAKNVGIEYLNGIPTYHLSLIIQNTPESVLLVQRFIFDYITTHQPKYANSQSMSFSKFLQETEKLNKILTQKIPVDMWVGQKNSYIYKLTTPRITFITAGNNLRNRTTTQQSIRFTKYNSTNPIVPPKNSESLQSFLRSIFGMMFSTAGNSSLKSGAVSSYGSGVGSNFGQISVGSFKSAKDSHGTVNGI